MSSISLRNVAAAAVLSTLLGLAAAPAVAQPRISQEQPRVEMDFATRVWLWLARISEHATARHTVQKTSQTGDPTVLGRAGAFDPNGG